MTTESVYIGVHGNQSNIISLPKDTDLQRDVKLAWDMGGCAEKAET